MAEPHRGRVGFEDSLNFTNSLCVAYTLCSAVLRGWIRRDIYGVDDAVIAAATVTTLGHFIANYVALSHGAGKPWSYIDTASDLVSFEQASMASIVLFTMSLYLSKCSVVAFLLRLTKDRRQILFYRASLVFFGAVGLASILLVTAGWPLDAGRYWASASDASACTTQSSRWAAWTALDIVTELLLLVLPINMAWKLQMPMRRKFAILSAFYMRVPTIAISIGRLVYTRRLCNQNSDLGLDTALVLIWICIEASYALLASHFLALRALTLSFNSGFGFGFTINAGPESYSMQQRSRTGNKSRSGGGTQDVGQPKPGLTTSSAEVRDSGSSSREASTMSIMRETEYSVQYQDMTDEAPILSRA